MIALATAGKWPDRWLSMILVGGFAHRQLAPMEVLAARLARRWSGSLGALASVYRVLSADFKAFLDSRPLSEQRSITEELGRLPICVLAQRVIWINGTDLATVLTKIALPIALVYGDGDSTRSLPGATALRRELTQVSEFILPNCGGHAVLTHPDLVSQVVRSRLLPACPHPVSN
jgi:pimeloyl-ACP methyl ester carboxylesterase